MNDRWTHVYHWGRNRGWLEHARAKWKGRPCRIIVPRAALGSVLVEFDDGERVVTSWQAVRRLHTAALSAGARTEGDA